MKFSIVVNMDRFDPATDMRDVVARCLELVQIADFSHLSSKCKFIALMPQWHFLDFLAQQGKRYPGFDLRMR